VGAELVLEGVDVPLGNGAGRGIAQCLRLIRCGEADDIPAAIHAREIGDLEGRYIRLLIGLEGILPLHAQNDLRGGGFQVRDAGMSVGM
jgi:hypothetical protein